MKDEGADADARTSDDDDYQHVNETEYQYLYGGTPGCLPGAAFNFIDRDEPWINYTALVGCQGVNLTSIPHWFREKKYAENVLEMQLSQNPFLAGFPDGAFETMPKLRILSMYHMGLTTLAQAMFRGLTQVTIFDVSANAITDVAAGTFDFMLKLQDINLSSNKIASLPPGLFQFNQQMVHFSIQGNLLDLFPAMLFHPDVTLDVVDLSYNKLTGVPTAGLAPLKKVHLLELQNSFIDILKNDDFQGLSQVQTLYINQNEITLIEPKAGQSQMT